MKRFLVAFLVCTAMLLAQTQAQAASKITVIVASSVDTSEQNYMNVTYKKLVELAQKYSDNAFDFQLFPSMQLGDEQETVRALQLGTLQMSMLATNNYAPFAPSCGWVNMPYLFDTLDEFRALLDAMWEQNNEWAVKEGGCRILSILDIGYRQLTTSAKHPVRKLADAKGIKIRTPQNALMVSTFKALGLEPTAVSFSETFNALQQGVVDGQEGCFNNVVTLKFYEAQKYATMINYSVHSCNFIVGERWLQSLPEKERNALIRAGKEAMLYERTKVADMLATDDKLMQEHGMELLGVVEDLPEWVRLGRTAWPKCYEVIGDGDAAKGKAVIDVVLAKKEAVPRREGSPSRHSPGGIMKVLRWLDEWAEEFCVSIMLSLLILLLGTEVFSRFLLSKSFSWIEELCRYLFVWASYLGVAIAVKRKEQLRVLMLMDTLEKHFPRLVKVCYVVSELSFAVFCVLVFYYSINMLENMTRFKQVSASLEINVMYAYLIIPISMAVTTFRVLQGLYRDFRNHTLHFQGRGD